MHHMTFEDYHYIAMARPLGKGTVVAGDLRERMHMEIPSRLKMFLLVLLVWHWANLKIDSAGLFDILFGKLYVIDLRYDGHF